MGSGGEWLQTCCERFAALHPEWNITFVYGVPFTTNIWYMYYDKRVFSEEDVKSLDAMLEKGVVSFPFTNSWYLPAFYFGNGCTLFGDGTQEELGADFGGENAVAVTDYLVNLIANPHFVVDADGSGMAGLRDGSINALFSGSWDYGSVRDILGDNLGAAALPCYTLDGESRQMYAYTRSKAVGVNAHSEHMVAAVELMGKSIRNGDTTHANAGPQTQAMNSAMNSDGIS